MKNSRGKTSQYSELIKYIEGLGHKNLNYVHSTNTNKKRKYEKIIKSGKIGIYDIQSSLIEESDTLIADISEDSVTVGYQIDFSLRKKIPVLAIYDVEKQKRISPVLKDDHSGLLALKPYSDDSEAKEIIKEYMENVVAGKIKFNFYISILLHNHITQKANKENKTKSDIIRDLIVKDMKENSQ